MDSVVWFCFAIVVAFVYKALAISVRKTLLARLTAVEDLVLLGSPRYDGRKIRGTAVICGGSIAGLLSARVCSDHFDHVLIIEPEAWVTTDKGLQDHHRDISFPGSVIPKRSRVAQYTALHVYKCFITCALRKLFFDSDSQLKQAGARILPNDPAMHLSGIPLLTPNHKYPNSVLPSALFFSRPGFETVLRKMVLSTCSNVKYTPGSVTEIVPRTVNTVGSVLVRTDASDGSLIDIPAALVVDCTGAARGGLRWLKNFYSSPNSSPNIDNASLDPQELKTVYDSKMAYTTSQFNIPSTILDKVRLAVLPRNYETDGNIYVYVPISPAESNTFLISRREWDSLDILCGGWNFRGRTTSISDIKDYISQLQPIQPIPGYVFALLDVLEAESVPVTYVHSRVPPSVYVQYFRATQVPCNFVALGDSVLQLNPVRGDGCTKACIDAVTLNALLARTRLLKSTDANAEGYDLPDTFSRSFFVMQAKRTGSMWNAHKVADYAWSSTVPVPGDDPRIYGKWARWYASKVTKMALKDRDVADTFWHVLNFLAPQTDLFSPGIVIKVLWTQLIESFMHVSAWAQW